MKGFTTLLLIILLITQNTFGQSETTNNNSSVITWSSPTARTIKKGRLEHGIFAPFAIGLKNNMEITFHPILFLVMPNAKLKKNWTGNSQNKLQLASEHGFTLPTLMLNLLASEALIGLYPPNEDVPPIFTLKNSFIGSYFYKGNHAVTFKTGIEFNLLYSKYGTFPEVELLYFYPRTASYGNPFTIDFSLGFTGSFTDKLGYEAALTTFFIPNTPNVWVYEFNPKVYVTFSKKLRLFVGVNLTTGNVPHEKQNFRAFPLIDLQWSFIQKRMQSRGEN